MSHTFSAGQRVGWRTLTEEENWALEFQTTMRKEYGEGPWTVAEARAAFKFEQRWGRHHQQLLIVLFGDKLDWASGFWFEPRPSLH